jgi:hypothetical protein
MDLEGKFSQVTGFILGSRTEATLVIQALWQNPKMSSTPLALQPTYQHYSPAEPASVFSMTEPILPMKNCRVR